MDLGWLQAKVAAEIGVTEITICNWETQRAEPAISHFPAIIAFLGNTPYRTPSSFGDWLAQCRRSRGLSQQALAKALKKDESTVAQWERGDRIPVQKSLLAVRGFFLLP
jgi:transcriptional regulator with XRE-family HTH domain